MNPSSDFRHDIDNALKILKGGGIILYPTDTIWGIGCDATNEAAVRRIYKLKEREDRKSMLVLLANEGSVERYTTNVPEIAWELLEVADTPLTIIYPGARNFAPSLVAEDGSIGIRITKEEFTATLINRFGKPLVSTSANISGKSSPANFSAIDPEIIRRVDYVVHYRQDDTTAARPSSIIKLGPKGEIVIIRK
jgi:L-threonylcarbamoyladenylate synthase